MLKKEDREKKKQYICLEEKDANLPTSSTVKGQALAIHPQKTIADMGKLVRFDWAIKRLLRQKANFGILEGLLSVVLEQDLKIMHILESESNKETLADKYNRVDILAQDAEGQLLIVEVQNNHEIDYFHRMLYGSSKAIVEHIHEGERYGTIRKVYSVNIVYFSLGQGVGYAYRGRVQFTNMYDGSPLQLSEKQQKVFIKTEVGDIFPEYYILRVNDFNKQAVTPLDEWMRYFKSGEIDADTQAKGLREAKKKLDQDRLGEDERIRYQNYVHNMRIQESLIWTALYDGEQNGILKGLAKGRQEGLEEGLEKGRQEGLERGRQEGINVERQKIAMYMLQANEPIEKIMQITSFSLEEIQGFC